MFSISLGVSSVSVTGEKPQLPVIFSPKPLQKLASLSYNIIIRLQRTIPPKEYHSIEKP
jgi:hypothetical protein